MRNKCGKEMGNAKGAGISQSALCASTLSALAAILIFLAACLVAGVPGAYAQTATQSTFSSADDALKALVSAATEKDRTALAKLFGPEYDKLLTGDQVEDNNDLQEFASASSESAQLQKVNDSKFTVTVGHDNWPMPIPLVQKDGKWLFDTKAGLEEVLNRKIGEDELSAITTCRAYAVAQWEYFTEGDWDQDSVAEYAQKMYSTPGKHDGLYWENAEEEKPSPLGRLVATAQAEGYGAHAETQDAAAKGSSQEKDAVFEESAPYHGYYFKILTRQGAAAPGGKYSYIINGNMIAGYALVAYPSNWGRSGVMTFIINQQGRVYQKNLGANTAKIASAMSEYNPDPSWKLVEAQP